MAEASPPRTEEGAPLRQAVTEVLERLRAPEGTPRRLVLPDGKHFELRIYGEHADGRIDTGLGVAKVTKGGVEFQWNTNVRIEKGRRLQVSTEFVISR